VWPSIETGCIPFLTQLLMSFPPHATKLVGDSSGIWPMIWPPIDHRSAKGENLLLISIIKSTRYRDSHQATQAKTAYLRLSRSSLSRLSTLLGPQRPSRYHRSRVFGERSVLLCADSVIPPDTSASISSCSAPEIFSLGCLRHVDIIRIEEPGATVICHRSLVSARNGMTA